MKTGVMAGALVLAMATAACATARADLGWTDATGEDGYRVYSAPDPGGPWTEVAALPQDAVAHTEVGLAEGVQHCFRVNAYNSFDPTGIFAGPICATPGSPAGLGGFFVNFVKE